MDKGNLIKLLSAVALLIVLGSVIVIYMQGDTALDYSQNYIVMDTTVTVQFSTSRSHLVDEVFAEIEAELYRLEAMLSAHLPDSDVSKISAQSGQMVSVHQETLNVVATALDYAELTQGAFDITLAPVLDLYDFAQGVYPNPQQLETALALVDWRQVQVDSAAQGVGLTAPGMGIDLGAIAKGYITDRAAEIVEAHGIKSGLINAGGDISFIGPKVDGSAWRVGIKHPVTPQNNFAIANIDSGSIVTSGDYERYFFDGEQRFHHILDPRTGYSANLVRSVTVVAATAEEADILSTAVFVMGAEKGLELIEGLPGVETIIWDQGDEVIWSSGLVSEYENEIYNFTLLN